MNLQDALIIDRMAIALAKTHSNANFGFDHDLTELHNNIQHAKVVWTMNQTPSNLHAIKTFCIAYADGCRDLNQHGQACAAWQMENEIVAIQNR